MKRPSLSSVTRKVSARRGSLLAGPKETSSRPVIKVRSRGLTPLRSANVDLPSHSTFVPSTCKQSKVRLMATVDNRTISETPESSRTRQKLDMTTSLERDIDRVERLETLRREVDVMRQQRDLAKFAEKEAIIVQKEHRTLRNVIESRREPAAVPPSAHRSPLPKPKLKVLKVQPITPQLSPHLLSPSCLSPQAYPEPSPVPETPQPSAPKQKHQPNFQETPGIIPTAEETGGGPEISRKLRELIVGQKKKYEAFLQSQAKEEVVESNTIPTLNPMAKLDVKINSETETNTTLSKLCENGLVTVIEEQNDDDDAENSIIYEENALNPTPSCSIKIKRRVNAAGGMASLKSSLTDYLSGTSKALTSTVDTIKASSPTRTEGNMSGSLRRPLKKESTTDLDTSLEDRVEVGEERKSKIQESLVELLKSIDLKAARDEIRTGFMGISKEEADKARQISKIRARVHSKQKPK